MTPANNTHEKLLGPIFIFLAALLFSVGGLCIKLIPWAPLSINGARNLISLFILSLYLIATKKKLRFNRWVFFGALLTAATTTLFVFANKLTSAANTIVLQYTAPVFIILFMWLFFREKPKRIDALASAVVILGILLFFLDSLSAGGALGNTLALLSGATYAGVFMLKTFPDSDPLSSIFFGQCISAAIGLPFLAFETNFTLTPIAGILILGVFQLGLSYILFTKGLEHTPPVAASLISGIEPILNPVLVAIFYGERISALALVGALIVLTALIAYNAIKAMTSKPARG